MGVTHPFHLFDCLLNCLLYYWCLIRCLRGVRKLRITPNNPTLRPFSPVQILENPCWTRLLRDYESAALTVELRAR
jgi:hypothetical protein